MTAREIKFTQSQIRDLFVYDTDTGLLKNRIERINAKVGATAGGDSGDGYVTVSVHGEKYAVHRLIWIYVHGSVSPNHQIDHINHVRSDNRLCNLRLVTHRANGLNQIRHSNNTSGTSGVTFDKSQNKWVSIIRCNGSSITIGAFTDKRDAVFARKVAERVLGFHKNHGEAKEVSL